MKKQKKLIQFKDENEEFNFWSKTDSTKYIDKSTLVRGYFPDLKPTTRAIPLRLPVYLIEKIKILAHKLDMPYQSLIKMILNREIEKNYKVIRTKAA